METVEPNAAESGWAPGAKFVIVKNLGTVTAGLNRGFASALLATQLTEARDSGARVAYLQVRADNPARRIYERFGFRGTYDHWYRALPSDAN